MIVEFAKKSTMSLHDRGLCRSCPAPPELADVSLLKFLGDIPTQRVESILSLSKGDFNVQLSSFDRLRMTVGG
jgi:hypothetical protein